MSQSSSPDSSSEPLSAKQSTPPSLAQQIQGSGDLQKVFSRFDANGDGKISITELESVLRSLGNDNPREEAASVMKEGDSDGDGCIAFDEFKALMETDDDDARCMEELRKAFDMYDENRNGEISARELHHVLHAVMGERSTIAQCEDMIKGVDLNHDGVVTFDEFIAMMTRTSSA